MEQLNWRDHDWRDTFFSHFLFDLRFCDSEHLERSRQNIEEYNSTRQRCQGVFNYYLPRINRIVGEIETTDPPREIVSNIMQFLQQIIVNPIFEGIIDEVSERFLPEEHQIPNPMLQGNNQEWSELSLVNHYNKLYGYYMRVILYLNRNVEGGRKKYRKSKKAKKSRKSKGRKNKKSRKYK
jgi:hypothetical protein